jgi:hypothetical protein
VLRSIRVGVCDYTVTRKLSVSLLRFHAAIEEEIGSDGLFKEIRSTQEICM